MKDNKKIKIGVIGAQRGKSFAVNAKYTGMELVAICDKWEKKLNEVAREYNVTAYKDYDKFLSHDMDAVVLANYFHQHAPFAIKALKAGKHVLSECTACFTLAEGVKLIEAVEETGNIYMLAENYPYMLYNQEMKKVFDGGSIGEFQYGEGEYVHPSDADFINEISPGMEHWRNWLPATYYCTHSLAPLMYITDTVPVKVNGFMIEVSEDDPVYKKCVRICDTASVIMVRMDNGATIKLLQVVLRGEGTWTRIHGSRGLMENLRHGNEKMVRIVREQFHEERRYPKEVIYLPDFPEYAREAEKAGHGGGDFFTDYHFARAIREGRQPYLDVYKAVAMSLVGILAYRSALEDSNTVNIPDFRKKTVREKFKDDEWTPDPENYYEGCPPPSIKGKKKPSKQGMEYAKKVWEKIGYKKY